MTEQKFKFTKYLDGSGKKEVYEKTEAEMTEAEKQMHLGQLVMTWENTCGWAQNMFLHALNNSILEKHEQK